MVDWTFQVEVIEKSCRKDRPMTARENIEQTNSLIKDII